MLSTLTTLLRCDRFLKPIDFAPLIEEEFVFKFRLNLCCYAHKVPLSIVINLKNPNSTNKLKNVSLQSLMFNFQEECLRMCFRNVTIFLNAIRQ